MRILVFGDIHGCSHALNVLLDEVAPTSDDQIITLGDYIDRGPDSRGVIDRLIELSSGFNVISLRGNHEQLMCKARFNPKHIGVWDVLGGRQTRFSYAHHHGADALSAVPERHWEFLEEKLIDAHETDTHIFVHAGLDPDLPLDEQSKKTVLWKPFENPRPHESGKIMVCGHTVQRDGFPTERGGGICIDTGLAWGGWLTCLDITSGTFWQSMVNGATRKMTLDEVREMRKSAASGAGAPLQVVNVDPGAADAVNQAMNNISGDKSTDRAPDPPEEPADASEAPGRKRFLRLKWPRRSGSS